MAEARLMRNVVHAFQSTLEAWCRVGASKTLLRWASKGFQIPLSSNLLRIKLQNFKLDDLQRTFISKEVAWLLACGPIRPLWPYKQALLSPVGAVPKILGSMRMIVNLRLLNTFVQMPKFKFNGLWELAAIPISTR